jgi:diguanylate cyclase
MTQSTGPVEIARQALRRLAELGLPPTPENYEAHYLAIAGSSDAQAQPASSQAHQTLEMVRTLLQLVTQANDGLHSNLGKFDQESRSLMAEIESNQDPAALGELFRGMTASAGWLLSEVEATRQELEQTRAQLGSMHDALQQAHTLANTDALTGLPNRRGIDITLSRELARARRMKSTLCVAIIDIDHFKRINDQYGHAVGDEALVHLADIIRPAIRETDAVGRYGGEEFLLVLPDTALSGAEFTLNRLLRGLEREPLATGGHLVQIRFSAGLAQWQPGESAQEAIERADQAMYAAKEAGRGRVHVAEHADLPGAAAA